MTRALAVVATLLAMAACQMPQAAIKSKPAEPKTVTLQPGDVPGMQRCASSGDINAVLQQEKTERSLAYDMNATEWEQWKRQGAVAAYLAIYGASPADCATVQAGGTGAPRGELMVGLVVEFNNETGAAANYKRDSTLIGLGPKDIRFIELAGGTTTFGKATGLGPESVIGSGSVAGTDYFVAMWRNKRFESDFISVDVADTAADAAVLSMNRRIH